MAELGMAEGSFVRRKPSNNHVRDVRNRNNILFVTVCVAERRPLLSNDAAHRILVEAWTEARAWLVGRYVVMPDHVHLFCSPAGDVAFDRWLSYWKRLATQSWAQEGDLPLWVPKGWDTQIRDEAHYREKWDYMSANPVRKGLSEVPEDWAFQGELHRLRL